MVPLAGNAEAHAAERYLARLRCSPGPGGEVPRSAPPLPHLRCGWCHAIVADSGTGHLAHCPRCRRAVTMPTHIALRCARCGHHRHVRPRELNVPRVCGTCGLPLVSGDVVLAPKRHHHAHHRSRPSVRLSRYGDAAWAVLVVGLALTAALLAVLLS